MNCTSSSGKRKHNAFKINALSAANCNLHPFKAKLPGVLCCLRVWFRTRIILINANEYYPDFTEVNKSRIRIM